MGGKSYFCDYCQCYMKNDKNVRKTHNDGMQHKIIKSSILRKYEEPKKLYEEEINKQPCFRYFKGYCKYGLYCQFTHFSNTQLKQLQEIVKNFSTTSKSITKSYVESKSKEFVKPPWQNKFTKTTLKLLPPKLPPSLRPLNLIKLSKLDTKINEWE